MSSCQECYPGTYQPKYGKSACDTCPPGAYNNETRMTSCLLCELGYYQPSKNSTECLACSGGTFSNSTGATECFECDPGNYQPDTNSQECLSCPLGTFQNTSGATHCTKSPAGTFVNITGATAPTNCTPGTYQSDLGGAYCIECPNGTYQSASGMTQCDLCPPGEFSNDTGLTFCYKYPPDPAGTDLYSTFLGINGWGAGIISIVTVSSGASIQFAFALLEVLQLISLFTLINVRYLPWILQSYYRSLGVSTFEFIPNILSYILPDSVNPANDPSNSFSDNSKYHSGLEGKAFLYNIGNLILLFAAVGLMYPILLIGERFTLNMRKIRVFYENNAGYLLFHITFFKIFLCIIQQIKYISFPQDDTFFTVSSSSALAFLALELIFLIKDILFYYRLKENANNKSYFQTHSPLLSRYSTEGMARFTPALILGRLAITTILLVILTGSPVVQSLEFLLCNFLSALWFVIVRPGTTFSRKFADIVREVCFLATNGLYINFGLEDKVEDTYGYVIIACLMCAYLAEGLAAAWEAIDAIANCIKEPAKVKCHPMVQPTYNTQPRPDSVIEVGNSPTKGSVVTTSQRRLTESSRRESNISPDRPMMLEPPSRKVLSSIKYAWGQSDTILICNIITNVVVV
eukprot:TRINITY_DN2767_c0_g1_i17.p1 TRINITY_DN2767_c0_g1~~TRINITY_DN2767_c0_g1_i17.p1  ORF type:complete len:633 (+),score=12.61 TRINITY_DN2767_c0_g1_i17:496-2394(+)